MSASNITRPLIERYLRATGWRLDPEPSFIGVVWRKDADFFPDHLIDEEVTKKPFIRFSSFDLSTLGMLAAAEMCCERAESLDTPIGGIRTLKAIEKRRRDRREAAVLCAEASRIVARAGVDPTAWEKAKCVT